MWRHEEGPIFIEVKTVRSPSDGCNEIRSSSHLATCGTFGASDLHQTGRAWVEAWIMAEDRGGDTDAQRTLDLHRKALAKGNHGPRSSRSCTIGRLGKCMEKVHDRVAIELRSRCDRAAIVTPSWRNHLHNHQTACIGGSRPRSTHDRGPIVVRSWPF